MHACGLHRRWCAQPNPTLPSKNRARAAGGGHGGPLARGAHGALHQHLQPAHRARRACLLPARALPSALPPLALLASPPSPAAGSASPRPPQVHALVLFGPADGTLKRLQWCALRCPCAQAAAGPSLVAHIRASSQQACAHGVARPARFGSVKYRIGGLDYSGARLPRGPHNTLHNPVAPARQARPSPAVLPCAAGELVGNRPRGARASERHRARRPARQCGQPGVALRAARPAAAGRPDVQGGGPAAGAGAPRRPPATCGMVPPSWPVTQAGRCSRPAAHAGMTERRQDDMVTLARTLHVTSACVPASACVPERLAGRARARAHAGHQATRPKGPPPSGASWLRRAGGAAARPAHPLCARVRRQILPAHPGLHRGRAGGGPGGRSGRLL